MPAPLAKGLIIAVSVLVAAGLAAYESPQIREWVDNSRRKIAMALHSLGDEISPRSQSPPTRRDPSMNEDSSAEAEERRRKARQEILERGRIMEEKRRKKSDSVAASFDSLVDSDGNLRQASRTMEDEKGEAVSTGADLTQSSLLHRDLTASRQIPPPPFELPHQTEYDQQMASTSRWSTIDDNASSHPSESLIDYTPTSEVPDPDISIPGRPLSQSEYFPVTSFRSPSRSQTLEREQPASPPPAYQNLASIPDPPEFYYAHPSGDTISNSGSTHLNASRSPHAISISSAPSIIGSGEHLGVDLESVNGDGVISEFGDGIVTPASWTDVESDAGSLI